ncbi:unnamed protein product [Protopolystoma xenopodis]|uniref:Uncharacterized protein n=1 Tax=Protopolystoma xenopodis TaxID=117903 RepID=A0A3S5BQ94_9PLAT|nr:unnamed protein product [Protopolystoma xenopodis]
MGDICLTKMRKLDQLCQLLLTQWPTEKLVRQVAKRLAGRTQLVIPFFGGFLSQLKCIMDDTPPMVLLPKEKMNQPVDITEDVFTTSIGVGGLLNICRAQKTMSVLKDVEMFQRHAENVLKVENEIEKHFSELLGLR